jgi:hypothetical protein
MHAGVSAVTAEHFRGALAPDAARAWLCVAQVLQTRKGIPLSLAVLAGAVARRLGMQLQLLCADDSQMPGTASGESCAAALAVVAFCQEAVFLHMFACGAPLQALGRIPLQRGTFWVHFVELAAAACTVLQGLCASMHVRDIN